MQDPFRKILPSLYTDPFKDTNSDIKKYAQNVGSTARKRQASREAVRQLSYVDEEREAAIRLQTQAKATADTLALDPEEEGSFLSKVGNVLDTPSRVFTRPLMATGLAALFALKGGKQAGEDELRAAATFNPLQIFFDSKKRKELNEALTKTKLPRGVYTALELGLDPIGFIPVGRAISPGLKVLRKAGMLDDPARKTAAMLEDIAGKQPKISKAEAKRQRKNVVNTVSIDDLEEIQSSRGGEGYFRNVGNRLAKTPGFRQFMGVINPRSLARADDEVKRAAINAGIIREQGDALAGIAIASMAAKKIPFVIDDDGFVAASSLINAPKKQIAWADLFQKKSKYTKYLSKEQQEYITEYSNIVDEVKRYALENNIPLRELGLGKGETYIPRIVTSRNGFEQMKNIDSKPLNSRTSFQQERYYRTMAEGIKEGVRYINDPLGVLSMHVKAVYRVNAERQFINKLSRIKSSKTLFDSATGKVIQDVTGINIQLGAIATAKKLAAQIARGEVPEIQLRHARVRTRGLDSVGKRGYREIEEQLLNASKLKGRAKRNALSAIKTKLISEEEILKVGRIAALERKKRAIKGARGKLEKQGYQEIKGRAGLKNRWFKQEDVDSFRQWERANDRGNTFLKRFNSVNGLARAITAGLDFGGAMIQGFPTLMTRPDIWGRAQYTAFRAMKNPRVHAQWKAANAAELQRMAKLNVSFTGSEYFEGAQRSATIGKIPVLGTTIEHAGAGFNAFGDVARFHMFKAMEPMAQAKVASIVARSKKSGKELDAATVEKMLNSNLSEMGESVSKMTGTLSNARLGMSASQEEMERAFLFAPRYLRSTVGLVADTMQGNIRGATARRAMANMLTGGFMMHMSMAAAMGQEPKLDPRKADFLSVELKGNTVGIGGAWISLARTMSKIYVQSEKIGEGEEDFSRMLHIWNPEESVIGQFARFKTTPLVGLGWDYASGRNALGEPMPGLFSDPVLDTFAESAGRIMPFSVQGLFDSIDREDGLEQDWERAGTGFVGDFFGLKTFPTNAFNMRTDRRNELAVAAGAEDWDTLDPLRKRLITEEDSELIELEEEIRKYNLENADEVQQNINEMYAEKDKLREGYVSSLNEYELDWKNKKGTGEDFRRANTKAAAKLGAQQDLIYAEGGRYAPGLAQLKAYSERGDDQPLIQVAMDEYVMRLYIGADEKDESGSLVSLDDAFGQFNYEERNRREQDMIDRYGEETINNVKLYFDKSASLPPMAKQLKELRDLFSPYWEVGSDLAERQGLKAEWERYKKFYGTSEADSLERKYPLLKRIVSEERETRDAMRRKSPLLDAFLIRYGYASEPKNREVLRMGGKKFVEAYDSDIQTAFPI